MLSKPLITLAIATAATATASSPSCPSAPLVGPFYLTAVSSDSSTTPVVISDAKNPFMALGKAYTQQFGIDYTSQRLFPVESSVKENGPLLSGGPVIFTEDNGPWGFDQVEKDCAVYLVKEGTADQGILAWSTDRTTGNLQYEGQGGAMARTSIRIDLKKPDANKSSP